MLPLLLILAFFGIALHVIVITCVMTHENYPLVLGNGLVLGLCLVIILRHWNTYVENRKSAKNKPCCSACRRPVDIPESDFEDTYLCGSCMDARQLSLQYSSEGSCANCGHIFEDNQEKIQTGDGKYLCNRCSDAYFQMINEQLMLR